MTRVPNSARALPTMMLCAAFLVAHFAAALHAFEHDPTALDGQVCATCITAAHLGLACVDTQTPVLPDPVAFFIHCGAATAVSTTHVVAVRQRGPPAPA